MLTPSSANHAALKESISLKSKDSFSQPRFVWRDAEAGLSRLSALAKRIGTPARLNSWDDVPTTLMADACVALGKYLGTHADNLVYTQNVTIALNIVARSLELGLDDEVLTSDHEYGALDRTWRLLSKERGFKYFRQKIISAALDHPTIRR